jgi:hypothetical protein
MDLSSVNASQASLAGYGKCLFRWHRRLLLTAEPDNIKKQANHYGAE